MSLTSAWFLPDCDTSLRRTRCVKVLMMERELEAEIRRNKGESELELELELEKVWEETGRESTVASEKEEAKMGWGKEERMDRATKCEGRGREAMVGSETAAERRGTGDLAKEFQMVEESAKR